MFTVNSSFLLIKSFVPSNGSINQKYLQFFLLLYGIFFSSSLNIGISGYNSLKLFIIISLDFLSAIVKGDLSFLYSIPKLLEL